MSDFHDRLVHIRHDLHKHPELGFEEDRTKRIVADKLKALGIEVHEGVGVVGVLKRGHGNRSIGLRADMDALPILETSEHDYVSTIDGKMHACGHDGHTTMLLGAAELISQMDFDGTVVFLFQPNEEHGLGAQAMIDEGVLDKHPIQEVYGIHNFPGMPLGHIGTRTGQICASESLFEFKIEGQGGHASMPHVGVETITVGAELVMALQTIVSRKLPPEAGAVLSVTEFISNGQRNVLPGKSVLKGDVRARTPEHRQMLQTFMQQIADGIAAAHAVKIDFSFNTEFIEAINAAEPTAAVVSVATQVNLPTNDNIAPRSFSEDFGRFSANVPGCCLVLGNGESGRHGKPLHASDYDFNDDLLVIGANFWSDLVKDRLPPHI